jgi:hypothetical protein
MVSISDIIIAVKNLGVDVAVKAKKQSQRRKVGSKSGSKSRIHVDIATFGWLWHVQDMQREVETECAKTMETMVF